MSSLIACTEEGLTACIADQFAQCTNGAWVLTTCSPGTVCRVLPMWLVVGTSVTCDDAGDASYRLALAGVPGQ